MSIKTSSLFLVLALGFAACTDGSGSLLVSTPDPTNNPLPPAGGGDFDPQPTPPDAGGGDGGDGNNGGGTSGTGGAGAGGGGGAGGNGTEGGGTQGGGGGEGGQPVPEPATMLLVGSGVAGAAAMRRRKQKKAAEQAD